MGAVCQCEWVCAGGLARSCVTAKRSSRWPQHSLERGFPLSCCFYPPLQFLPCNPVVFGSKPTAGLVQDPHALLMCRLKIWGSLGVCAGFE